MEFLSFIWNPDGTLFTLGAIQIKYYNLLWITAFGLGYYLTKKIFLAEKKPIELLDSLFVYAVLSTMLGARLGHVFFYDWDYYKNHLIEILLPIRSTPSSALFGLIDGYEFTGFAGLASHGATIGILIGLYLYIKKHKAHNISMKWLLDRVVVPISLGAFLVRLGNFFNSEINGKIVDKSYVFATKFLRDRDDLSLSSLMQLTGKRSVNEAYKALETDPAYIDLLNSIPYRHPAQLYEGILYLGLFFILHHLYWKTDYKNQKGFLFGLFFVCLWTIRFLVEFIKKSQGGFEESLGLLSTGQWLSIPFILVGIYFMKNAKKS